MSSSPFTECCTDLCHVLLQQLVKKGNVNVPELYNPVGMYYYTAGVNWRAVVALICAVTPNLPGMIQGLNPAIAIGGAAVRVSSHS